jgi:hypothetical protein
MSHIVNHPSFIAAALARREEILAECEQARLAALARPQSSAPRPVRAVRLWFGDLLIRWGRRLAGPAEAPITPELPAAPSAPGT